jgi:hypothetical protein
MDRSRPGRRMGKPVSAPTGPRGLRPSVGGRWVMRTGAAITLIVVGVILRFALTERSHGLNVHVVGVALILVGFLGLLLSLLTRGVPRRSRSLVRQRRGGYYDLAGPNERLARTRQAAAEDVAQVQGDDRFFAPDAPGGQDDDP